MTPHGTSLTIITLPQSINHHSTQYSHYLLQYRYGLPQLQVPLEISAVLGVFLTVLEHKKNIIGKLLHAWFKTTTGMLGLERYLMPLQYEAVLLMPSHPHYHRYRNHTMYVFCSMFLLLFLFMMVSLSLSLIHLLLPACTL
jgi:hypothetical protein